MMSAGDDLLCAHTDGAWTRATGAPPPDGWRIKGTARRMELLDPQVLRYWPSPPHRTEPWTVMAGQPSRHAPAAFDRAWSRYTEAAA
jgi:hypothetical protein